MKIAGFSVTKKSRDSISPNTPVKIFSASTSQLFIYNQRFLALEAFVSDYRGSRTEDNYSKTNYGKYLVDTACDRSYFYGLQLERRNFTDTCTSEAGKRFGLHLRTTKLHKGFRPLWAKSLNGLKMQTTYSGSFTFTDSAFTCHVSYSLKKWPGPYHPFSVNEFIPAGYYIQYYKEQQQIKGSRAWSVIEIIIDPLKTIPFKAKDFEFPPQCNCQTVLPQ